MVQLVKALYAKSDNLEFDPWNSYDEWKKRMTPASYPQTSAHVSMCEHTKTYLISKQI